MQDGTAIPAQDAEQSAWAEFWELLGDAAYQLWRSEQTAGPLQESA